MDERLIKAIENVAEGLNNIADSINRLEMPFVDTEKMSILAEVFHHDFPIEFYVNTKESDDG